MNNKSEVYESKVTNGIKAKELMKRGHEVVRVFVNRYDSITFVFEKTDRFIQDWNYIQDHYEDLRQKVIK